MCEQMINRRGMKRKRTKSVIVAFCEALAARGVCGCRVRARSGGTVT